MSKKENNDYKEGLEDSNKTRSVVEIFHQAVGLTPSRSERSEDYQKGLEDGKKK
jgi:hypothetical protein